MMPHLSCHHASRTYLAPLTRVYDDGVNGSEDPGDEGSRELRRSHSEGGSGGSRGSKSISHDEGRDTRDGVRAIAQPMLAGF